MDFWKTLTPLDPDRKKCFSMVQDVLFSSVINTQYCYEASCGGEMMWHCPLFPVISFIWIYFHKSLQSQLCSRFSRMLFITCQRSPIKCKHFQCELFCCFANHSACLLTFSGLNRLENSLWMYMLVWNHQRFPRI